MIDHPECFQDMKFKELIGKVKLLDLIYDSIRFYLQYFPSKTNELLVSISSRLGTSRPFIFPLFFPFFLLFLPFLEPARVVSVVSKLGQIPIIKKYLELVQDKDIREVNNALHDLYIDEEDFDSLRGLLSFFFPLNFLLIY